MHFDVRKSSKQMQNPQKNGEKSLRSFINANFRILFLHLFIDLKIISFAVPDHIDPIDTFRAFLVFPKEFWAHIKKKKIQNRVDKSISVKKVVSIKQ